MVSMCAMKGPPIKAFCIRQSPSIQLLGWVWRKVVSVIMWSFWKGPRTSVLIWWLRQEGKSFREGGICRMNRSPRIRSPSSRRRNSRSESA